METYIIFLFTIIATCVTIVIIAGCGFLLIGMWEAVKERLNWL